jgi:hypothetical protein
MIIKATKKALEITAILWDGNNVEEVRQFCTPSHFYVGPTNHIEILDKTRAKWVPIQMGDVIIKGIQGEVYPCAISVFKESYDILEGSLT